LCEKFKKVPIIFTALRYYWYWSKKSYHFYFS